MENTTERQLAQQVIDLAKVFGWLYYRTWLSMHSPAGFPDLVMVRGQRQIYAELKSEKGKVTPKQGEWLTALSAVPQNEVYLWRPSNFDAIVQILQEEVTHAHRINNT